MEFDQDFEGGMAGKGDVVSPLFIAFWFGLMSLCIFVISWMHFQVFTPRDSLFNSLKPISPSVIDQFGGNPGVVQIGLVINQFHNFRVLEDKFSFGGTLWFKFDPSRISMGTIEGITLANGIFLEKSQPYTSMVGEDIFVRYAVRIEFQTPLNFEDFPDDDHRLYLVFTHEGVSPGTLVFESARPDFLVLDERGGEGWMEFDRTVESGYFETRLKSSSVDIAIAHPAMVFGIDFRRTSMRDFVTILLPLVVMLGISLCSFATDRNRFWKTRIEFALQSIIGAVAFRFVLETMSPKVGYFMVSDGIFFLFFMIYTIIFLINLIAPRVSIYFEKMLVIAVSFIITIATYFMWNHF